MKEKEVTYVRHTQRDYRLSFKLQILSEVGINQFSISGALRKYGANSHSTILNWIRKYGTFDREYQVIRAMSKTPEQKFLRNKKQVWKNKLR